MLSQFSELQFNFPLLLFVKISGKRSVENISHIDNFVQMVLFCNGNMQRLVTVCSCNIKDLFLLKGNSSCLNITSFSLL